MWLTRKKAERLKEEIREEARNEAKRRYDWAAQELKYIISDYKVLIDDKAQATINTAAYNAARSFLYELADLPPQELIEKLVQKINAVQLEK